MNNIIAEVESQPNLFEWTPPYRNGQDTSREASESVQALSTVIRLQVMNAMQQQAKGWTADEMAEYLHQNILNVRPRFSELVAKNMICDTGERRPNRGGRNQRVYAAVVAL